MFKSRSKNSGSDIDDLEYFKGFIEQIAVFDVAMSKEDIKKISLELMAVSPSDKLATTWGQIKK